MGMSNQIETQIDVSLTERNRLTAFFRIILVVPAFIFISSFAPSTLFSDDGSAIFAGLIALPAALAIVVRQVYPSYVLAFNEAVLSLQTRVDVYLLLLSDQYPSIEENDVVSVTFPEVDAKQLNRWLPLIKWLLALPLYLVGVVYLIYAALLTVLGWFSILFTGNYPEVCAEGVVGTIAYWNRVVGYAFLLVTDEYPTFSL
jgi:Mn2+/Fe2+ NRAMP family transporter